jgi:hypothetical protein
MQNETSSQITTQVYVHGSLLKNCNWKIVSEWKLESCNLQIVLTKQQNNKEEKHDKAKDLEPIQRGRLKTHLVMSILLKVAIERSRLLKARRPRLQKHLKS